MVLLPTLAAFLASLGWATGIVLAQAPARQLGAFEFTRIQLLACSGLLALLCSLFGYWSTVDWTHWPAFAASICIGIIAGNLAMIACLRRGGPRRTELLLTLKAPLVTAMAFVWLQEIPAISDLGGAVIVLCGVGLAIAFGTNDRSHSDARSGSITTVIFLGLCATACQGFGFLVMKPAMLDGTAPLAASAIRLTGASFLVSLVALWPSRLLRPNSEMTPVLLARTVLPGVIGYGLSSSLLLYAFAHVDAGIAAVLGSLSPVLVLPILWWKEGIPPSKPAVAGAVLAVMGTGVIILF